MRHFFIFLKFRVICKGFMRDESFAFYSICSAEGDAYVAGPCEL